MAELTKRQQAVYDFIVDFTQTKGYPPAIREICAAVGLKSPSSAHAHIKTLQREGYINKDDNKTRALTPVTGSAFFGKVPILGRVRAGAPVLAIEEIEGYLPFDSDGMSGNFFALNIVGDSMINAGMMEGDYVIVREQRTAMNGEIVVALIGEEATVKRLSMQKDGIWLLPENPDYEPIDGSDCTILGVVMALFRRY